MPPEIRLCDTLQATQDNIQWFLETDLSYVANDTETMGKEWFKLSQEKLACKSEERQKVLQKEMDDLFRNGEALDPKRNHLATMQVAAGPEGEERCLVFVLTSKELNGLACDLLIQLQNKGSVFVLQNAKFDLHQYIHHLGLDFKGVKLHDTQLCEVLINGAKDYSRTNLDTLTHTYECPVKKDAKNKARSSDWWSEPLTEEQVEYAGWDAISLLWIARRQITKMEKNNMFRVRKLECTLIPRLVDVERCGVKVDKEKLFQFLVTGKERQKNLEQSAYSVFEGVNLNAPLQVLQRIKDHYGITPISTKYNKELGCFMQVESSDKYALLECGLLKEPAIRDYIWAKEMSKNLQTAGKWLDGPDRMHVSFFQLAIKDDDYDGGARSGRTSSTPNLQNNHNFMKQFIIADDGYLIGSSDYSAIQLKLIASIANDKLMKRLFNEGVDLHSRMAHRAFHIPIEEIGKKSPERRIGKEINFGFPFGMGWKKWITRVIRGTQGELRPTEQEARAFRDIFFKEYGGIAKWHQRQFAEGCRNGYAETRVGRRRYYNEKDRPMVERDTKRFWDPKLGMFVTALMDYKACYRAADWRYKNILYNHPIQGAEADGAKDAVRLACDRGVKLFSLTHDSLEYLIPEDQVDSTLLIVDGAMKDGMLPHLPDVAIEVEHTVGRCWASKLEHREMEKWFTVFDDPALWQMLDNENEWQKEIKLGNV